MSKAPGPGKGGEALPPGAKVIETRKEDRLLPIANISRIMKRALPVNAKVAKEAKVFTLYLFFVAQIARACT